MRSISVLSLALLLATSAQAAERRPVSYHTQLKPDAKVFVDNLAGVVQVKGWDKNELSMTGSLGESVKALETTGDSSSMRIVVRHPKIVRNPDSTELFLFVPKGVSLEVDSVSADVTVSGLKGEMKIDSVSGDVLLEVHSAKVSAGTVSGDIHLKLGGAEEIRAASVSGDVTVSGGRGELHSESVSGDVRIEAREVRELEVESVSGDVDLDLELDANANVEVETLSGGVRLVLSKLPDGLVEIESFSGDIEQTGMPELGSGKDYRKDGPGKGRLSLTSFSGDVVVRKK